MLRRLTVLMAVLAAFATPAPAASIEWQTITQYNTTPMQNIMSGTDAGAHVDTQSYGQAYVGLQGKPYPAIVARSYVDPTFDGFGGDAIATGTIKYDYMYTAASIAERDAIYAYATAVCAGRPACNIFNAGLVSISGRAFTSAGPNAHSEVSARAGGYDSPAAFECLRGNGDCGLQNFTTSGALASHGGLDFIGTLELTAYAHADGRSYYCYYPQTAGACDRAEAWIDPVISLNSGFAWSGQLVLSPEFANAAGPAGGPVFGASGVPEPASWALMIGGLGLAGAMRRAARRRLAASA